MSVYVGVLFLNCSCLIFYSVSISDVRKARTHFVLLPAFKNKSCNMRLVCAAAVNLMLLGNNHKPYSE